MDHGSLLSKIWAIRDYFLRLSKSNFFISLSLSPIDGLLNGCGCLFSLQGQAKMYIACVLDNLEISGLPPSLFMVL